MQINETFNTIEKGFNVAGGIPFVGWISGSLRSSAGIIQAVVALIFAAFSMIAQIFDSAHAQKWEQRATQALEHVVHGGLNYLRGMAEVLTSIFAIPLIVQCCREEKFEPIFKYGQGFAPAVQPQPVAQPAQEAAV